MKKTSLTIFVVIGICTTLLSQQSPAPGTDTGIRLGNIIRGVIETALPAVGPLVSAIWPSRNPSNINRSELETQLRTNQTAQKAQIAASAAQLRPIFSEVNTIKDFLVPCNNIQDNLRIIDVLIAYKKPASGDKYKISSSDWDRIKSSWNTTKQKISELRTLQNSTINCIREVAIRNELARMSVSEEAVNIISAIVQINLEEINDTDNGLLFGLREKIFTLLDLYHQLPRILVFYFDDLKKDFSSTVDALTGAATVVPSINPVENEMDQIKNNIIQLQAKLEAPINKLK